MVDVEERDGEASWENPAGSDVAPVKAIQTPFFNSKQFGARDDEVLQEDPKPDQT